MRLTNVKPLSERKNNVMSEGSSQNMELPFNNPEDNLVWSLGEIQRLETEVARLTEYNQRLVEENASWMTNSQKEYILRMKAKARVAEAKKLVEKWRRDYFGTPANFIEDLEKALGIVEEKPQ